MLQKLYTHKEIMHKLRKIVEQAWRFKELEAENARLKKLVADLSLDNEALKEAASKNTCLISS
jgi:hypothetical protein